MKNEIILSSAVWWNTPLPYRVLGPGGKVLMQGAERVRYPARVERALLEQGCVILLNGKRLTRKELAHGKGSTLQELPRPRG